MSTPSPQNVRAKLAELVNRFGLGLCDDPKQCEGLLRDMCRGEHKKEIHVLVGAVRESVPRELLGGRSRGKW